MSYRGTRRPRTPKLTTEKELPPSIAESAETSSPRPNPDAEPSNAPSAEAIGASDSSETSPHVRDKRSNKWKHEFLDIIEQCQWREIGNWYYKSECRPLSQLKPFHRQGIVLKCHTHSFREWLETRDRARKDLYWLGKECIGTEQSGSGFVEHVHREMCEMFVQKNFDGVYHKDYTLDEVRKAIGRQKREKEMLLLTPRGSFKSTANKIDCAQWMLNCPDIRILIMTGAANLSDKFLKEVKGFFYKPEGVAWTYFQSLFPEYTLTGSAGVTATDMVCPARICRQEGNPTLWVNSIGGVVAGWHCDLMKGDDIVNEENSNNEDTREKLKDRYDNVSANLPDEHAFRDHLGTRYYPDDWYGSRIADWKRYEQTNELKFLCRSAWTVKTEYLGTPIKQLKEEMVDLYFPEKLDFLSLIRKCRQNEKQFRCQQLNEPAGDDLAIHFDEENLRAHIIQFLKIPWPRHTEIRKLAIAWDTAHTERVGSDYSAGAVGWCDESTRTLYVLDLVHDKMTDSKVAQEIVALHRKWKPMFTEVEKFAGWELLAAEIQRVALRYGDPIIVSWRSVDATLNAKRNRVKHLETLLADDRLWFAEGDWNHAMIQQFVRFTGMHRTRKDDIPDAISRLVRLIPALAILPEITNETEAQRKAREAKELREAFAAAHRDSEYRTIFQMPAAPPEPEPEPEPVPKQDIGPEWMLPKGMHL